MRKSLRCSFYADNSPPLSIYEALCSHALHNPSNRSGFYLCHSSFITKTSKKPFGKLINDWTLYHIHSTISNLVSNEMLPSNLYSMMYIITFDPCFTEPMSKGSSHQQLEEDVENEEQREKFEFEDDIGKQKGKTASGDETSGKCSELKTHSSKLNDTQEKHADPSQAITTVSPAGQECTSSHSTSKFAFFSHSHTS